MSGKLTGKQVLNKILAGMSMGIIIALLPGAFVGEVAKMLNIQVLVDITNIATRLTAPVMGLCIAMQFKMSPIQSGTLAIATMVGSGALKMIDGNMVLNGMGDVLNAGITAAIAVGLLFLIGDRLKSYTILLLSTIVVCIGGLIGVAPYLTLHLLQGLLEI